MISGVCDVWINLARSHRNIGLLLSRYNKELIFNGFNNLFYPLNLVNSCCDKKETPEGPAGAESTDDPVNRRDRGDSQTEPLSPHRLSQTIGPGTKYSGNTIRNTSDLSGYARAGIH